MAVGRHPAIAGSHGQPAESHDALTVPGTRPQVNDITAVVGGEVLPQTASGTLEFDHQAFAWCAVDIADVELAASDAPLRKQVVQDGFESI
jgi:hypothetical protein